MGYPVFKDVFVIKEEKRGFGSEYMTTLPSLSPYIAQPNI